MCVDIAHIQEVYMLSPEVTAAPLFTHNTEQSERIAVHRAKLAFFVTRSLRLSPILRLYL